MADPNAKCWIRYNNKGARYTICGEPTTGPKTPLAIITKPISLDDWTAKNGNYSDLSEGQKRAYHAHIMRIRRYDERMVMKQGEKFIDKYRQAKREERIQARKDREKHQEELRIKRAQKKKEADAKKTTKAKSVVIPKVFKPPNLSDNFKGTNKIFNEMNKKDINPATFNNYVKGLNVAFRNDIKKMKKVDVVKEGKKAGEKVIDIYEKFSGVGQSDIKTFKENINKHIKDNYPKIKYSDVLK